MRFDAEELVQQWAAGLGYPKIHQAIAAAAEEVSDPGEELLDLGSSTGLLARQLHEAGHPMTALEASAKAAEVGKAAGVYSGITLHVLRITPAKVDEAVELIASSGASLIVARRILPELHDSLGDEALRDLWTKIRGEGTVRGIVLEGRVVSPRSTHPLLSADAEAEFLTSAGWTIATPPEVKGLGAAAVRVLHG